ncbi:MAG: ATP-binding protein [Bacillota bacterium]
MFFERLLGVQIEKQLFKGRVVVLFGARRVGKTTLVKSILAKHPGTSRYINCDLLPNQIALANQNKETLRDYLGNYRLIVLDEAQRVENIGMILKIIADELPDIQVIATGSSSFDLANKTGEPLTGRARHFLLPPLALAEIESQVQILPFEAVSDKIMRFGFYPQIFTSSDDEARQELDELTGGYLYKDVLEHERVRRPEILLKLLQALALQIGSEVSVNELCGLLGVSKTIVENYIDLLEKCFVIFRLSPFSRNLRNELSRKKKIYFYDIGVRNSLIQNFAPPELRNDKGALWENFCIAERMKRNINCNYLVNSYFWRTHAGKEIDYIEERDGQLHGYEFKWSAPSRAFRAPQEFLDAYENANVVCIDRKNWYDFLVK